jgi:organic radical activating enzyme
MQDTFIADKPKLNQIALFITGKCTLACAHCLASNIPKEDLEFEEIKKLLESVDNCEIITITGGEPTLHPRFKEIVLLAAKHAKTIWIGTNGLTTNDNLEKAREQWLWLPKNTIFLISEDELHENERSKDGLHKKIDNLLTVIRELGLGREIRTTVKTQEQANLKSHFDWSRTFKPIGPQGDGYYLVKPYTPKTVYSAIKSDKEIMLTTISDGTVFWGNPFITTLTEASPFYLGNIKKESIHRILERYAVMLLYTKGLKYEHLGLFRSLKDAVKLRRAIKRRGQKKIMLETYRTMEPPKRMHYKPKA